MIYRTIVILTLFLFILGCSSQKKSEKYKLTEFNVDTNSLLLNADSTSSIGSPSIIKAVPNGFLLYDFSLHKITQFDYDGNKLVAFGNQGRGPGEFQSVSGFWKFDDTYLVYDVNSKKFIIYDLKGNPIKDLLLDFVEFPGIPLGIEAIGPKKFVIPSGGKGGTLLRLIDIKSENVQYLGTAVVNKHVFFQSSTERRQAISSGNIPDMYKNRVLLGSNSTGFFSFQQTTAILEKYAPSGNLVWQKNLKVPTINKLFEKLFEKNRARINNGELLLPFSYADGISANEKGIAVLLNVLEEQPVTVVWVPNNGEGITVVTFREIENPSQLPFRFTISNNGSYIFFVNTRDGKIIKANWPL